MGKSLAEAAKAVLMNEGQIPSVSSSDNNPDRDAGSSNPNMATLKPKSKASEPDPKHNEAEDLGGATPTSTAKENLGAKAAVKGKDTSKAAKSATAGQTSTQKLSEKEEETEEEGKEDLDEELEAIIAEMIESGMTEEEIEQALEEAFGEEETEEEVVSEEVEAFIAQKIEEGLSDEEIEAAIAEHFEVVSEETEEETSEETPETVVERPQVDMREHVDALLEGEDLSEEFRAKATTIFESAVNAKLEEEVAILEETYAKALEEETAKIYETLSEQVDDYLSYVVEKWVEDNEVAIEPSLKTELTEGFIASLRNLFVEHYISIPDDQVSVVEELGKKVEELEAKLNEEIETNVSLTKQLVEATRSEIFSEACDGLSDTQSAKLQTLAEGVEFTTPEEFSKKLKTIKENYFPTRTPTSEPLDKAESTSDGRGLIAEELNGPMAAYVKTLGKKLPI